MNASPRILLYSHDTFGLGHIRRNRKIAGALAVAFPDAQIVIATGSTHADSFSDQPGVTIEILPAVRKKADGTYESEQQAVPLSATIAQRRAKLEAIVSAFDPDILITDKEAKGLLGELEPALATLKARGGKAVLGLREVLDAPEFLRREWALNGTVEAIERWYDEIWIYGPADFHDPLEGQDLPASVQASKRFLGFLAAGDNATEARLPATLPRDYILVTTGGGGDGEELLRAVIGAGEAKGGFPAPVVILPGPFLSTGLREEFTRRAGRIKNTIFLDFQPDSEAIVASARAVIGMCGYNTFCEVIEFDKPALFVPRESPRREQLIRARLASQYGLSSYMRATEAADPERFAAAIRDLLQAPLPSAAGFHPDFAGMNALVSRVHSLLPAYDYPQEAIL